MKFFILLFAVLCFAPLARAQYSVAVVADPIAQLNHVEDIAKWTESIATLNSQLQQMQQYVQLAQTMKGYIGDPASAAGALSQSEPHEASLDQFLQEVSDRG